LPDSLQDPSILRTSPQPLPFEQPVVSVVVVSVSTHFLTVYQAAVTGSAASAIIIIETKNFSLCLLFMWVFILIYNRFLFYRKFIARYLVQNFSYNWDKENCKNETCDKILQRSARKKTMSLKCF
jgi:hypothetical protein